MLWSTRTPIYLPARRDGSVGAAPKNGSSEWAAIGRASHHHTEKI
jgi:NDP-sugar pyrophosphorylase family protein